MPGNWVVKVNKSNLNETHSAMSSQCTVAAPALKIYWQQSPTTVQLVPGSSAFSAIFEVWGRHPSKQLIAVVEASDDATRDNPGNIVRKWITHATRPICNDCWLCRHYPQAGQGTDAGRVSRRDFQQLVMAELCRPKLITSGSHRPHRASSKIGWPRTWTVIS